jgi:pyruvate formate lyase activating enzyme
LEKKVNTNSEPISRSIDAVKPIYSITPFTLLDYPDKTACILWFAGCNMRCAYCYNPDIVLGKGKLTYNDALKFINSRRNLLDGVVLSGGECTLHKSIASLLKEIKEIGLSIKIDTNGTKPELLRNLIREKLVDYIALDFKASPEKFIQITKSNLYGPFRKTLEYLIETNFPFEVRTTVHADLLNQKDLQQMVTFLENKNYKGIYYLQNYMNNAETLGHINNSPCKFSSLKNLKTKLRIITRN